MPRSTALLLVGLLLPCTLFAQQTCPCVRNPGSVCQTISVNSVTPAGTTCITTTSECSGCVCSLAVTASEVCTITTGSSWRLNGTANYCVRQVGEVVSCPAATPPPVTRTQTTCCDLQTTGSISNAPCSLKPWNPAGISGVVLGIERYITSTANVTTTYVASSSTETFSQTFYNLQGSFTYTQDTPPIFINFQTPDEASEPFLNPPGQTIVVTEQFSTFTNQSYIPADTALFTQIISSSSDIVFTTSMQFGLSGPGASVRVGQYEVSQCLAYVYQTTA